MTIDQSSFDLPLEISSTVTVLASGPEPRHVVNTWRWLEVTSVYFQGRTVWFLVRKFATIVPCSMRAFPAAVRFAAEP